MIRGTDIEKLYSKIDGHIMLVGSYISDRDIVKIIKICRLKPYSIFTNDFEPGTRFESHWVDEFGNSLKFKDKDPFIVLGDSKLVDNTKISTDLFFGNSLKDTMNNSDSAIIVEDSNSCVVGLYGKDEYLRVFAFNNGWHKISPLLLGIKTIKEMLKSINNVKVVEIDSRKIDCCLNKKERCMVAPIQMIDGLSKFLGEKW